MALIIYPAIQADLPGVHFRVQAKTTASVAPLLDFPGFFNTAFYRGRTLLGILSGQVFKFCARDLDLYIHAVQQGT